ncbi:MAG: LamG domain-containing protein [Candidatus Paceibacterota bacterium]|jgi:prepilin-type N-terminal cleavage/methylation domain-containing protein
MRNKDIDKVFTGFTLIELLVVISIISTLSSIVLASLSSARDKSKIAAGQTFDSHTYQAFSAEAVGIWNFDEGTGNTTLNLATGNMETISGVTWVDGIKGKALNFDGTTDGYVDIADIGVLPAFTLTAWVYNVEGGDSQHSILNSFWEIIGKNICYYSYCFGPSCQYIESPDHYWRCSTDGSISYNKWTHIATTWNGSVISHYVNGKLVWKGQTASSGTSQPFYLIAGYAGRKFKGILDEIRVYNQSLQTAKIEQIYAESLPTYKLANSTI